LQPSCLAVEEASIPESADTAEPVVADPKIYAKEELEVINLSSDPINLYLLVPHCQLKKEYIW
jgi:hypothetical protein